MNPAISASCCGERDFEEIEFAVTVDRRVVTGWTDEIDQAEQWEAIERRYAEEEGYQPTIEIVERVKEY